MVGYCRRATQEHALFFPYGTGANGKSVFVNVLTTIPGRLRGQRADGYLSWRRAPTGIRPIWRACAARALRVGHRNRTGRRWNESKVKAITGGDKVSARFMRQDFFEYVRSSLVIAGNHKAIDP